MQAIKTAKIKTTPKPWMSHIEIDIIESILLKLNPQKCLEWGSGFSTAYFPHFISDDSLWVSVEHDKKWYERLQKVPKKGNVLLNNVAANKYPWTDRYKDGSYNDLKDYIEFPGNLKNFDFILIDGRARSSCILKAREIISPFGIAVLHDANRKHYHPNFSIFDNYIYLKENKLINGGLWIGSIKNNLMDYISFIKTNNCYRIFQKNSSNFKPEKASI